MFATPAFAQAAGSGGAASPIMQFVPLILIFAIMYFLMIRPQQKRAKQHREMVASLSKGDHVVTQGGVIGKVASVRDDEIEVEIAQGVKVRIVRATVAQVVNKTQPVAANS
ncbi:preprotein translocase subunit YajC [Paracoccus sp. Z330]|uniref:Sec translocon accessory complex subunit YajC n=1 Tax=Paracoccus onchidii TaxID=3017813 RepID=A0ABT4ZDX5_9RHOB|nr:preprotein translocase subunit YajC [Paracoccus onchidii]MDB6177553.1 preprotein translocase subunit YajC [Paracoccus onchidii]